MTRRRYKYANGFGINGKMVNKRALNDTLDWPNSTNIRLRAMNEIHANFETERPTIDFDCIRQPSDGLFFSMNFSSIGTYESFEAIDSERKKKKKTLLVLIKNIN